MLEVHTSDLKDKNAALRIFYDNSKNIQSQYLGGKKSNKSREFRQELKIFNDRAHEDFSVKKSSILEEIKRKDLFEEQLRYGNTSVFKTLKDFFER
jgi:hypothetical protein